jgi:hypothetical protein
LLEQTRPHFFLLTDGLSRRRLRFLLFRQSCGAGGVGCRLLLFRLRSGLLCRSLIGFGGGVYRCPGAKYGTAAIQCVLATLYRNFALKLVTGPPMRDFQVGVIRPRHPCLIAYQRREKRALPPALDPIASSSSRYGRTRRDPMHAGAKAHQHAGIDMGDRPSCDSTGA